MNPNRTYGIELEFASSVSFEGLTDRLNNAFVAAGSNHRAICTAAYHHNTDGNNYQNWDVKTDGSIQAPDVCTAYPYGIEIASPVLKGTDGLAALKIVTDVLDGISRVGKTTGLHVHHGVRSRELVAIAKSWTKIQTAIYLMLPTSRRNNSFCRPWRYTSVPNTGIRQWYRHNVGTRYVGLNLESFWIRGTVEFHMAAGSTDYTKISNWAIFTQMLIDNASKIAASDSSTLAFSDVKSILSRNVVSSSSSANIPHSEPRRGTKSWLMWNLVNRGLSLDEITRHLIAHYGSTGIKQSQYRVGLLMDALANPTSANTNSTSVNDLDSQAIAWASNRYDHFSSLANNN